MNSIIRRTAIAFAASTLAASPAFAGSATDSLSVSANVTPNCVVSVPEMDFGDIDATTGLARTASTNLSVTCTNGLDWTATANAGTGDGATVAQRRLENLSGDSQIVYTLYKDVGRTLVWGEGAEGDGGAIADSGTGVAQSIPIYGYVAPGQTGAEVGSYSDTVQVTVSY